MPEIAHTPQIEYHPWVGFAMKEVNMQVRAYAEALLGARTLEEKLMAPPAGLIDDEPGPVARWDGPSRPPSLMPTGKRVRMPKPGGLADPNRRAVALHRFANHELQALEIMAWALLAFPDAPPALRRGMVQVIAEEQKHLQLYADRMWDLAQLKFGDLPVNHYFWDKVHDWTHILHYISAMSLTFEAANLDFAQDFGQYFKVYGDEKTAAVIDIVHQEEIRHVALGMTWLKRLKNPDQSDWQAYTENLIFPLHPARARGKTMDMDGRLAAGLSQDFLDHLTGLDASMTAAAFGRKAPKPQTRPSE